MYALAWILPLEFNISQKKTAWIRGYVEDKGDSGICIFTYIYAMMKYDKL
jgi:hypothetical protein